MKCQFCNKNISRNVCCEQYKKYKENIKNKLSYNLLYDEYVNKEMSINELKHKYNLSWVFIDKILKEYKIEKRGIKKSRTKRVKEKYKKTCLKKYGVENTLSKNSYIRKQMEIDILKKYGVDNVFQLESVKRKAKETCLEKYGYDSWMKDKINACELYEKIKNKYKGVHPIHLYNPCIISRPHKQIIDLLKKVDINIEIEYPIYPFFVDILINKKYIIEVYGDYWHANPKFYNEDDILNLRGGGSIKSKEIWKSDKNRLKKIKEQGYIDILILWEDEINKNIDNVEKKIWEFIKLKK